MNVLEIPGIVLAAAFTKLVGASPSTKGHKTDCGIAFDGVHPGRREAE
jgi:hypothetical protein